MIIFSPDRLLSFELIFRFHIRVKYGIVVTFKNRKPMVYDHQIAFGVCVGEGGMSVNNGPNVQNLECWFCCCCSVCVLQINIFADFILFNSWLSSNMFAYSFILKQF